MPYQILTIAIFFLQNFGLGYTLTRFTKGHTLETTMMRIAIGLGATPALAIILSFLRIPMDARFFLGLVLLMPVLDSLRFFITCVTTTAQKEEENRNKTEWIKLTTHNFLLLSIFAASLCVYASGAFIYPWLENDDSWTMAASIKYITIEKTIHAPQGIFQYLNPYPFGYSLIMSLMHQWHPSLYWVLKFFNALIISLGFLFFYYFVKQLTTDRVRALWSTLFLAMIPCYLSHFIWAHALAVSLFFAAFYLILKTQENPRFILPAALTTSGIFLTQPTQSIKFVIMLAIMILIIVINKKPARRMIIAGLLAIIISLGWWGPKVYQYARGSSQIVLRNENLVSGGVESLDNHMKEKIFSPTGGSATRKYTLIDYIYIPINRNKINNPLGVGSLLCNLALFGLILFVLKFKKYSAREKIYAQIVSGWLIFTFLGVNSATFQLPVGLYAFRFWMLFAIPVCLLATEPIAFLLKKHTQSYLQPLTVILAFVGVLATSGYAKFIINTSFWPWGVYWHSRKEIQGYLWLKDHLTPDTKVLAFTDNVFVIGNNMRAEYWREDYQNTFRHAFSMTPLELNQAMTKHNYDYLIIGQREIAKYGQMTIENKLRELETSEQFDLVHVEKGAVWVFKKLRTPGQTTITP